MSNDENLAKIQSSKPILLGIRSNIKTGFIHSLAFLLHTKQPFMFWKALIKMLYGQMRPQAKKISERFKENMIRDNLQAKPQEALF